MSGSAPAASIAQVAHRQRVRPRSAALQGKALEVVTQVLLVTALPRLLGPSDFGRLTLALSVVTIGTVAISLGAPSAFARFIPAEAAERQAGLARSMTLQLLRVRAIQFALIAVVALVLVRLLPQRFPPMDTAIVLAALALEVAAVIAAQIALGIGRTRVWSFRIAAKNAALLMAVPVFYALWGAQAANASLIVSSAAGLLFAGWTVLGVVRGAPTGVPIPEGATRYGIVAGCALLVGQLTFRAPVIISSLLDASPSDTGFAALAASLATAAMLALREIFTVSLPEQVEHWGRDQAYSEGLLRRIGVWSQLALVACALIGVFALERGLPLLVGNRFDGAMGAIVSVLALLPLLPLPLLGWQAAALQLRPGIALAMNLVGLVAFVVTAGALASSFHALGATMGLLAAVASSSLFAAFRLPKAVSWKLLATGVAGSVAVLLVGVALGLLKR